MDRRSETEEYLNEVERFAHRKFLYRNEIAALLDFSLSHKRQSVMDEVVFYAKFITKAHDILRRQGIAADDTQKLSQEYSANIVKITALMRALLQGAAEDVRQTFEHHFFLLSHDVMENFITLLNELSWLKNFAVDKKA